MSKIKSILATPGKMVVKAITSTKDLAQNANGHVLNATEDFVSESLIVTAQWQGVANKAIKGGLKLAANQQDLVFDTLSGFKNNYKAGKKRYAKLMS